MVDPTELKVEVPKTPKKRGRKPKNVEAVEPVEKIPKKRGRKPKIKLDDKEPKIPKKRGRKPKDSYLSKTTTTTIDTSSVKGTILHLKINSNSLENGMLMDNMYDYNPNINTPRPYDPNNNNLYTLIK